MIDFQRAYKAVKTFAFSKDLMTDITDVSYPIPSLRSEHNLPLKFMLYYVLPDIRSGYTIARSTKYFAQIELDLTTFEIISWSKRTIDLEYVNLKSKALQELSNKKYVEMRNLFMLTSNSILEKYWGIASAQENTEELKVKYLDLFNILAEQSLLLDYKILNEDFWKWVEIK